MSRICLVFLLAYVSLAQNATKSGTYQVTLRPPAAGIYAQEETEIEFRIEDTSRPDPLTGSTAVIRARIEVAIAMPAMAGMPPFKEVAHTEGVPGDYGVHPTFAHGGEYVMKIAVEPAGDGPFQVEFPLTVADAVDARNRKRHAPRFTLELSASPKSPKAGEPAALRLAIHDREHPKEIFNRFEFAHEQLMHLVIVRADLSEFAHEHPALGPDGAFTLQYQFRTGGEYHLFADVAPKDAGSQVLFAKLKVGGKGANSVARENEEGIQLKTTTVPARKTSDVCFSVSSLTGLQPYLGARAHLIAIHEDALTFVHAHPDESKPMDGTFTFQGRFPRAGLYRVWIQFKRNDRVVTGEFTIEAKEN
jgi:hypothetical protein